MAETVILTEIAFNTVFLDVYGVYGYVLPFDGDFLEFPITLGDECVVVWEGEAHSVTVGDSSAIITDTLFVGNGSAFGLPGNNEPFVIAWDGSGATFVALTDTSETRHTVAIYQGVKAEANLVLKDRQGNNLEGLTDVMEIKVPTSDGGFKSFLNGTRIDKIIGSDELNFSEGDVVVTPNIGEMFGSVTIPKPPTLLPENIMEGVTIAGVDGTAKSGGDEPSLTKPIRFYNAYGDVIYSFTRAEIAKMTELPEGPALGNLTFYDWDCTLDKLKNELYFCDVAPKYKNTSGQAISVMLVEILDISKELCISCTLGSGFAMYIDYGDGSTNTLSGSSSTSSRPTSKHTYGETGIYIISMYATNTAGLGGGSTNNSTTYTLTKSSAIMSSYFSNGNGSTPEKRVISLLGNSDANVQAYVCAFENNLRFVSGTYAFSDATGQFLNCSALKVIGERGTVALGTPRLGGNHGFNGCASLTRVKVTTTKANMFDYCTSLKEVEIGGTQALGYPEMNVKFSLLLTRTTPPTISATTPVWGTKPIYVPDEAVETYKAASGWSDAAAYIFPASQYPDK